MMAMCGGWGVYGGIFWSAQAAMPNFVPELRLINENQIELNQVRIITADIV